MQSCKVFLLSIIAVGVISLPCFVCQAVKFIVNIHTELGSDHGSAPAPVTHCTNCREYNYSEVSCVVA